MSQEKIIDNRKTTELKKREEGEKQTNTISVRVYACVNPWSLLTLFKKLSNGWMAHSIVSLLSHLTLSPGRAEMISSAGNGRWPLPLTRRKSRSVIGPTFVHTVTQQNGSLGNRPNQNSSNQSINLSSQPKTSQSFTQCRLSAYKSMYFFLTLEISAQNTWTKRNHKRNNNFTPAHSHWNHLFHIDCSVCQGCSGL